MHTELSVQLAVVAFALPHYCTSLAAIKAIMCADISALKSFLAFHALAILVVLSSFLTYGCLFLQHSSVVYQSCWLLKCWRAECELKSDPLRTATFYNIVENDLAWSKLANDCHKHVKYGFKVSSIVNESCFIPSNYEITGHKDNFLPLCSIASWRKDHVYRGRIIGRRNGRTISRVHFSGLASYRKISRIQTLPGTTIKVNDQKRFVVESICVDFIRHRLQEEEQLYATPDENYEECCYEVPKQFFDDSPCTDVSTSVFSGHEISRFKDRSVFSRIFESSEDEKEEEEEEKKVLPHHYYKLSSARETTASHSGLKVQKKRKDKKTRDSTYCNMSLTEKLKSVSSINTV
uniref:Uncharacterized protein n=1 Tax=Ditylenchus dipsaci TaxID=166011 RepID=A0A915CNX2_9BILA